MEPHPLEDPEEFRRPHRYPTLSASHPDYSAEGHYWRGGVWAPTNYMIVKGLEARGHGGLAREVAQEHLAHLSAVFYNPPENEARLAPEERDGDYATLWECYSPEESAPATRWDATYYSRQDFVGWTGLGPIAMLLENVLGFAIAGAENRIVWDLTRTDYHGVRNVALGSDNLVSLLARARGTADAAVVIEAEALRPFELEVRRPGRSTAIVEVCGGQSEVVLD